MCQSEKQRTYLGIDGTNWVHVLWHAKGGRGVVDAVVARAQALVDSIEPAGVVACFDRRSYRHSLVDGYKADRKPKPAGLLEDLKEAERQIGTVCTVAAEDGYEADDALATLAAHGKAARSRVILATPDKDLRQCLGGGVTILRSFTLQDGKPTKGDWYTEMTLFDEFGLEARQWTEYQMLVGDRGDCIEGCKGWGEKTAAKVLSTPRCRTLEECWKNPWNVPCTDSQRGELIKFRKRADVVRQLVTLRTDCSAVFDALR
jgi:DNA polymerase-1